MNSGSLSSLSSAQSSLEWEVGSCRKTLPPIFSVVSHPLGPWAQGPEEGLLSSCTPAAQAVNRFSPGLPLT